MISIFLNIPLHMIVIYIFVLYHFKEMDIMYFSVFDENHAKTRIYYLTSRYRRIQRVRVKEREVKTNGKKDKVGTSASLGRQSGGS